MKLDLHDTTDNFEIDRPYNTSMLYTFFITNKFQRLIGSVKYPLANSRLLEVCCGSGMISQFYAQQGAIVTGIDKSESCVYRANARKEKYGFNAHFEIGDATHLHFENNTFEFVSVHDGLHHIKEPQKAIREMARVARKGIMIIEPAKSFLTNISVQLGFSQIYEGDDYVYRFTPSEFEIWLKEFGFNKIQIRKYIMYYPHVPGTFFKLLSAPFLFQFSVSLFFLINSVFNNFGNKLQVVALK